MNSHGRTGKYTVTQMVQEVSEAALNPTVCICIFYLLTYCLCLMPVSQPLEVMNVLNDGAWNTAARSLLRAESRHPDLNMKNTFTDTSAVGVHNVWSLGTKNNMFIHTLVAPKNWSCDLNFSNWKRNLLPFLRDVWCNSNCVQSCHMAQLQCVMNFAILVNCVICLPP